MDPHADRDKHTVKGKGGSKLGYTSLSDDEPVAPSLPSPVLGGEWPPDSSQPL